MCDNNPPSRKKRDVEGSDEFTHEDLAVLMKPFKSNEHREKRSVASRDNATRYCAERLLEKKVGRLCAKLGTNVQALVNVCSADIQVSLYRCLFLLYVSGHFFGKLSCSLVYKKKLAKFTAISQLHLFAKNSVKKC